MKNLNQNSILGKDGINISVVDIIFGVCAVLWFFGVFPRDYQFNAPTTFVLCSLIVYGVAKNLSTVIRNLITNKIGEDNNTWKRFLVATHLPLIMIYLYIIA